MVFESSGSIISAAGDWFKSGSGRHTIWRTMPGPHQVQQSWRPSRQRLTSVFWSSSTAWAGHARPIGPHSFARCWRLKFGNSESGNRRAVTPRATRATQSRLASSIHGPVSNTGWQLARLSGRGWRRCSKESAPPSAAFQPVRVFSIAELIGV